MHVKVLLYIIIGLQENIQEGGMLANRKSSPQAPVVNIMYKRHVKERQVCVRL